jgi:hypothetical protein
MGFLELYDDDNESGYINSKLVKFFHIYRSTNGRYVVKATDESGEMHDASPLFDGFQDAYSFLDSIIEKLR